MFDKLFSKIPRPICALLGVGFGVLILVIAFKIAKSDEFSYAFPLNVTVKMNNFENRLKDALAHNEELIKSNEILTESLKVLTAKCMHCSQGQPGAGSNTMSIGIDEYLNHQSQLLMQQKEELNTLNKDFKDLRNDVSSHKATKTNKQ